MLSRLQRTAETFCYGGLAKSKRSVTKDDYDKNQPMWRVLPEFCSSHPKYVKVGLRDLCKELHDTYKENNIAKLTTQMYLSNMEPAMKPADAFSSVSRGKTDRVPIKKTQVTS